MLFLLSLSLPAHPGLHTMRWLKRVLFALATFTFSIVMVMRITSQIDKSGNHPSTDGQATRVTNWLDFLSLRRRTRIAILHDHDPDTEETFISVVRQLSHESSYKLTLFHGPFFSGYEEAVGAIWKGGFERYEDTSDPLAEQDIVVVTSSKVERYLKTLTPQLERHPNLRAVLVVHDSSIFDVLAYPSSESSPSLPNAVIHQIVSLVKRGNLQFLVSSGQVKDQLVSHLAMVDSSFDWSNKIHAHFPYIPAPRISRNHQINQFRAFSKLGMIYSLSREATILPHLEKLFGDLEKSIRADPGAWGYKRGEPFVKSEGKWSKTLELHILSIDTFKHTTLQVPEVLKNVIKLHGHLEADAHYKLLSTMDLIIPSSDLSEGTASDSSVALSLSARVPVLLPALYRAHILKHPAAIRYPKDMSVLTAVRYLRSGRDPRGKMAWMSRPWDRCDTVQDWTGLVEKVRKQNERIWRRQSLR